MGKIVFSGIQPSGNLHIGNFIGSLRQWVKGQATGLNIFCIVDMHAITVPQDPQKLHAKSLELAAIYLAVGIDPTKSILFIQSHNPDHANLGWVLNCYASMGQMNRMIQYKEKSEGKEFVSVGLFDYPALMAADILLYDTTEVPVGEDQKQHVELTRDLAERFNAKYGETFVLPKPVIPKTGGRIMSLVDPTKKMSKSDPNPNATIYLLDDPEVARKKVMSATTDSLRQIKYDPEKQPGISNLLEIYSELSEKSIDEIVEDFRINKADKGYDHFKGEVADEVVKFLKDFQEKYKKFNDEKKLKEILEKGAEKAYGVSHKKLLEVYSKLGFVGFERKLTVTEETGEISIADFQRADIRIGKVVKAEIPKWSHWVIKLTVDFGELGTKTIFTGMLGFYKPEDFEGNQFPFVINLKRKKIGPEGDYSEGMLMAGNNKLTTPVKVAGEDTYDEPVLFQLQKRVANGTRVC